MAGDARAEAKRKWLHELFHVSFAAAGGTGGGNDTDLMDPNAPDTTGPEDEVKQAEAEVDSAGKDVVAKEQAEQEAEATLAKARTDLDSAKAKLQEKTDKYYEAEAKAQGSGGLGAGSDLPAPMLPDCVPQPGRLAGPKEHVLCKTHGHVLNIESKTIIAHTVAEYDARHPVPRPMESDCKIDPGKIPNAPDNIVMCATHGHVLDTKKKQIIANSGVVYLKAHPEHAGQPKPKSDGTPAPAPSATVPATAKPSAGHAVKSGEWYVDVKEWKDLKDVAIYVTVKDHTVSYSVTWEYSDKPTLFPPPPVHPEFVFWDYQGKKQLGTITGPSLIMSSPKYAFEGKLTLKPDAISDSDPSITVVCRIILENAGAEHLDEGGFVRLA